MDDQEILDNIDGCMHGPMSGFIKKYFDDFQYVCQDATLEIHAAGRVSSRCSIPSTAPSPNEFLQWFSNYALQEVDGARGFWDLTSGNATPEPDSVQVGARLLLAMPTSPASTVQMRWDNVQVVGQFHECGCVCYQDGFLSLCRSAQQVFASQPTRLFLHGFYIRGLFIELWAFDRSGSYCSEVIDIRKDFIRFLSLILSYQRMTDQELGKSNIIGTDKEGNYIMLDSVLVPSLDKLYLESQPISSHEGIVGAGTTCYRARVPNSNKWDYVLKFKWRWARQRPEDELLRLAKDKNVWGTIFLNYYKEIESTANLRRSLRWGTHRKFVRAYSPETRASTGEQLWHTECSAKGLADFTEETRNFFQNRILACTVTSPVGRALCTFQSLTELLQVFHDAIKCHRSLFHDARILHQDISPGNIIILDSQNEGNPKGILIDLDSAVELAEGEETELDGVIGTRPFMAIGVLEGEYHTYRHDLESFFYVFLWTAITDHAQNPPETSKLRQWSNGDWKELAARKALDMNQDNFTYILEEFASDFHSLKPLAKSLRQILFPLRNGVMWTGSDGSPEAVDKLYNEMMRAFEKAIRYEGGRQI